MIQFDDVIASHLDPIIPNLVVDLDAEIQQVWATPYPNLVVDLDPEMPFKHEICLRCSITHFNAFIGPLIVETTCS